MFGYLVGHVGRRCPRPGRILEGVRAGESGRGDHVEGRLEILFGLTGESDDDVGGDGCVRHRRPHPLDDPQELCTAVAAAHRLEDPVRTRLQRHVQLGTDVRGLRHRLDHVVGELCGVRRREPHTFETLDVTAGTQQRGECSPIASQIRIGERHPVGIHVLAEQGDLDDPFVHQRLHLGEDVSGPAVDLLAAKSRNDAERAGVVATDRDRHPPRIRGLAFGGQGGRKGFQCIDDLDLGLRIVASAFEQHRQRSEVVCSEHDVDPRGLLQDGAAILLGKTAADSDLHSGTTRLDRCQMREVAVQLVVGVLPDGAGVEDHQVGITIVGCADITGLFEETGNTLGVVDIHLTAVGADLVGAPHGVGVPGLRIRHRDCHSYQGTWPIRPGEIGG